MAAVAIVGSIQFLPEQTNVATLEALTACGREISRKLGHGRGANFQHARIPLPAAKRRVGAILRLPAEQRRTLRRAVCEGPSVP